MALPRAIQPKHALRMLLTGDLISAETALSHGLVNALVPQHMLDADTINLAEKISSKTRFGIQLGKKMFYGDSLGDAYDFARERMVCYLRHFDAREGIDDFTKKKK